MDDNFEKLLKDHHLTAYRVAKDIGFSPVVFSDWKSGKSKPKYDKLQKIADYFKVSVDYLLGNEPSTSPSSISGTSIIITRNGSQTAYSVSDSTADAVEELLKNLTK